MHAKHIEREEGVALLTAVIFVSLAVIVLMGLSMRVVQQSGQVAQYRIYNDTFTGMEAAVARSWVELESGQDGSIGIDGWTPPTGAGQIVVPDFTDEGVSPESSTGVPGVEYLAYANNWANNGLDDNGDGQIDDSDEDFMVTIYGRARNRGVVRTVEVIVQGMDVNVWRNAIFAGAGQSGGLINGNVSIHGSVHLLGTNLTYGNTAMSAIDLSGTSLIHNNYVGITADLAQRVPPLPTRTLDGETVSTLNAKLRVRHGLVGMSGNSEIGEPNIIGNTLKETLDGTYVSDGWTGTSVDDDGGRGDPTHVWSDNGWDAKYDLGNKVAFPLLTDPYREVYTGSMYDNPASGTKYTHYEYFEQVLTGTPYAGNMTIRANQNFYYNATRPAEVDPALRQATDDYIYFDAASNRMYINGQVQVNGDLSINRGSGNDKTISYSGRGAVLVKGNATLDTDLYSINANGTTANSFPVNNFFGIMVGGDLTVGTNSQLKLMGAFYAQGRIVSSKQTIVMGTFVSSYFDMGTNVPEIYQVPELANNLPLGMIGGYPILVYSQVSWREIGV